MSARLPTQLRPARALRLLMALVALVAGVALAPAVARADGTPNLSLAIDAQDNVLFGKDATVALTTTNPAGSAAYNLSYRVVLPAGVSYVAGSAGAQSGEPVVVADQPATNQTTLLWKNLADVAASTTHALNFRVQHVTTAFVVGSLITINASVYAGTDERYPPVFTAAGQPDATVPNPYTGYSANKTDASRVVALEIDKTSDHAPDGQLLRGVHGQQAIYTVTIRNNTVASTTGVIVDDYLPSGLEFIGGCGTANADHTSNTTTNPGSPQEYPGAGTIPVVAVPGCVMPNIVETLNTDPTGPAPSGVYTHLRWSGLGTLAPGASVSLKYRAAVPLRLNTTSWIGGTPATSGLQAANLNNNSGLEVADGATLTNWTHASGNYNGTVFVTADGSVDRVMKDLTVEKAAQTTGTTQGGANLWDLTVRTSEYRSAANVVVTDTVPDGLCPLSSSSNFTQTPQGASDAADCGPGPDPSVPYATVQESTNGSFAVVWNSSALPALAQLPPNANQTFTFATRTRQRYQEGFTDAGPILARDVLTNSVQASADARVICSGGVACPLGAPTGNEISNFGTLTASITDGATAALTGASPVLDQKVADTSGNCTTATYTDGVAAPRYRPGDRICWRLRVDYPAGLSTAGLTLSDYLPPSLTYDTTFGTGGDEATGNDTVGATTLDAAPAIPGPGGRVKWTLPGSYVGASAVFEHRVATRVELPAGAVLGSVTQNLFKSTTATTPGTTPALRDEAPYRLSMPVMSTIKRVTALDGVPVGGAVGVATQVVRGGQIVTYRVRLTNAGDQTAEQTEAWDPLPVGVTCADVTASALPISDAGVCDSGAIKWGAAPTFGPDVPSLSNKDLTYSVMVPTTLEPTQALTSAAGIRRFQTPTNTGGIFTYIPAANVDPTQNPAANIVSPTSAATVTGATPTITKTRDTSITETDGTNTWNSNATATVGETIHYTVSATVPAGETVRDFEVTDVIDVRQQYVAASLTQTAGPAAAALGIAGTTVSLGMGPSYTAPTGADTTFSFTFDVTVKDSTGNYRSAADLYNAATMLYTPPGTGSGGTRTGTASNSTTTQIVEPVLTIDKVADVGSTPVVGDQVIQYTVTVTNGTSSASPAHETSLVDVVPSDMTPLNAAGNPILDGESTLAGGVWNLAARTLTFSPSATIYPGTTETFTYRVRVNDPAVGGKNLTNTATTTTTSVAGAVAGERTIASPRTVGYTATKNNTLSVLTPSLTKAVADATLTVGQRTTYTVDVTIPANTINYDAIVKDTLPDSIDFDNYLTHTCISGCVAGPTTPTIQPYTPVLNAGTGTVMLAWDLGDLTMQATVPRVLRLTYGVHLRATHRIGATNVGRPQTSVNSVRVMANRTDKVGAFDASTIPNGTYDDTSATAARTVTAIEPAFVIDKQIAVGASNSYSAGPVFVRDGDALKYRLTVTNTGNAPAYDVEITDTPNAEVRNLVTAAGVSTTAVTDPWTSPGDDIKWTIPGPIAPNGTATVSYTAALPVVTSIKDGDNFDNTAQVTKGYGIPVATRTADNFIYRSYTSTTDLTRATFDSPTITVDKTTGGAGFPDSAPVQVGQTFTWRVRVQNTSGSESATAVSITDKLPANWTYVAGSATFTPGGASTPTLVPHASGDDLIWSTAITLAPGGSTVLTYQARPTLASATTPGIGASNPHVNSATAAVKNTVGNSADENGPFLGAANTATAILSVPALTVAKTPDNAAYASGQTVPFHIVVANTGAVPATNVVVSDNFPAGLTYVPGAATATPASGFSETSGTPGAATWQVSTLAAGASVNITVPLSTSPAAPAQTITNTASVISDQTATAVTDSGSIILTPSADLAATKTATPMAATAGQALSYTLGVTNNGPSVAQDVVLTDVLPATVSFVSAPPECVYAPGPHSVTCTYAGVTAVGAAHSAAVNTTVVPGAPTNANNTVTASSGTADATGGNNAATVNVPVGASANLSLTKSASVASIGNGQTMTFDLDYASAGPSHALAAQIVDTLPAGLTFVSGPAGCSAAGQVVTCTLGTLASGDTGTRRITVRGTTMGTKTNTAALSSSTPDPATANNTATASVTVTPSVDLGLTKTGPPTVAAGGDMTYVLTTTNSGPDVATGVAIVDTLPAGTSFVSGDAGCGASGQTVSCPVGTLASGATETRNIVVHAAISAADQAVTNNASVRGAESDPNPANDVASASTQIGPAADLSVTQSAPATSVPGGNTTFTIVAHNAGPSTATGVTVTSELPDDVSVESVSSAQGTCTVSGKTVTCVLGNVINGGSVDITLTVRVPAGANGRSLTNRASVAADQPDPDGSNAAAGTTVQVVAPAVEAPPEQPAPLPVGVPKAQLALTKTTDQVARAGERLNYLITATNQGPDVAEEVIVTDALAGDVVFRSAKSSAVKCDYEKGTIRCPIGKLAVGDSVKINVAVTPNKAGMLVNNAVVSAGTTDPDLSDNRAVALGTVPKQKPTTLKIEKKASAKRVKGGQRVTYTLKVRNTGNAPAINVDICDQLPGQLAFTSTRGGDLKDARLCFHEQLLAPGAKKTFKVRTRVLARARKGAFSNKATAVADNAARVAGAARATVTTDGKVGSAQVRGFTG